MLANFKQLDDWGILEEINREILRPLGLVMVLDDEGGSPGCFISKDMYFESKFTKEQNVRFENFLKNRYYELTRLLNK